MSDDRGVAAAALAPAGRRYRGLGAEQRATLRRNAVLDAALELFGTIGYKSSTVKTICREARLTERYFYESFTDREDCLAAVYGQLVDELRETTAAAVDHAGGKNDADGDGPDSAITSGLDAFIRHLTADPRRAKVILVEVVGVSDAMEQRRHGVIRRFAELIAEVVFDDAGETPTRTRLLSVALAGGLNHLLVDWLMDGAQEEPEELVSAGTALFGAVAAQV